MFQVINHIPDISLALICPCPFYAAEPRTGPSTPDMASPVLRRREGSQPWPAGNTHPKRWVSPGGCQPSLLQECIAGSCTAWCPPGPKSFCKAASLSVSPRPVGVYGGVCPQVQDFATSFVEILEIPVCHFLQPAEVPLNSHTTVWCIDHSSQVHSVKLSNSVSFSRSLMGVLNGVIGLSINPCMCHYWLASGWCLWLWSQPSGSESSVSFHYTSVSTYLACTSICLRVCTRDSVERLAEAKINDNHCSVLIHQASHLVIETCKI